MGSALDEKLVIKHLINGTLGENVCIICLSPLNEDYENIFTKICKDDKEYCIADILSILCNIELTDGKEIFNVCLECFISASQAYKFYLLAKSSHSLLNIYADHLSVYNLESKVPPMESGTNSICIYLPKLGLDVFDFDLDGIGLQKCVTEERVKKVKKINMKEMKCTDDENVVIVINEKGKSLFYKFLDNGKMVLLDEYEKKIMKNTSQLLPILDKSRKVRKQRDPMSYKTCSQCPVKYRFVAKLRHHMKTAHNINLYLCKICKAMTENEVEYHNHMRTHTNIHQCAICDTVFKRRETIIAHLKWHDKMNNLGQAEGAHICEVCGLILDSAESLTQHWDTRHCKKYTCYYCGRMYKGEGSFESHIKKHEQHLKRDEKKISDGADSIQKGKAKSRCTCSTCGRNFVDQRALMWHERLHNNERPYKCDVCGRGFVSVNRRNQHAMCAHTAPARRCPLCPALFHLRSMVNTHVKKVHLKSHKRRNRSSKYQNVYWRTEPVPIQDLSVSIQNEILEIQAANEGQVSDHWSRRSGVKIEDL